MKIEDLDFKPHPTSTSGTHAETFFANGYGTSIVTGRMFYTTDSQPYEIAVLKGTKEQSDICYSTDVTDDVLGYLTEDEANMTLKMISDLDA